MKPLYRVNHNCFSFTRSLNVTCSVMFTCILFYVSCVQLTKKPHNNCMCKSEFANTWGIWLIHDDNGETGGAAGREEAGGGGEGEGEAVLFELLNSLVSIEFLFIEYLTVNQLNKWFIYFKFYFDETGECEMRWDVSEKGRQSTIYFHRQLYDWNLSMYINWVNRETIVRVIELNERHILTKQ